MVMIRANRLDLFFEDALPALEALSYQEWENYPSMIDNVYNKVKINREMVQYSSLSDLPAAQETAENADVPYVDVNSGFNKTYIVNTYKLGFQMSEEMVEDDRYQEMQKYHRGLGRSHFQTRETLAAAQFNDGFGNTGYDGVALFATTHPLIEGGTEANTLAAHVNLSRDGLRSMIRLMEETTDEQGYPLMIRPKRLVIHPNDEFVAQELLASQGDSESANLKTNAFNMKGLNWYSWQYLTDENAFFLQTDVKRTGMKCIERVPFSTEAGRDFDSGGYKVKSRQRFVLGYDSWRGLVGTSGTT